MTVRQGSADFPHRAYIEALADAPEGSPAWHAIVAGYAALQLFESWAEVDEGAAPPTTMELRRVRRYIEAAPESHPARRCLMQLVETIARRAEIAPNELRAHGMDVARHLSAYAKLLQYDARWALAADVHLTIIAYAPRVHDDERLLDSMLMRGFSLRMLGRLDDASNAYAALRSAATFANNERYRLESYLSDAKVAVERGNFPAARELLDRTIADARRSNCQVIISKGLTDRARVAAMQGEFELALTYSYEALERSSEQMDRERILGNIAATFAEMGLRDAARDAGLLVAATAQDRSARLMALVNLMELAYLDDRELVFEQYRRELAREELAPYLRALYLETCAQGFRHFGRYAEARTATERMLAVAEEHGLHEFVMKAESALREPARADSVVRDNARTPSAEPTSQVATIMQAIAEMRIAAGLPG